MSTRFRHAPASTRHAFTLAWDLAVRRDAMQSLVVPFLLSAPWALALTILPEPEDSDAPGRIMLLRSIAMLAEYVVLLAVTAMLRFRARSVYNTGPGIHPGSAVGFYRQGLARLPWLFVTETVRSILIAFAAPFLVLPAIYLGYRLSFATEAVVLNEPNLARGFARSFHLTQMRFERWLEMIAVSVVTILSIVFAGAVLSVFVPGPGFAVWYAVTWLAITAVTPIIQYAWTFFYLRLVEVEGPGVEVGPLYAASAPAGPDGAGTTPSASPATTGSAGGEPGSSSGGTGVAREVSSASA